MIHTSTSRSTQHAQHDLTSYASANRDERVFADPDTFDVDRVFTAENKILAFGEGIHSRMGVLWLE